MMGLLSVALNETFLSVRVSDLSLGDREQSNADCRIVRTHPWGQRTKSSL